MILLFIKKISSNVVKDKIYNAKTWSEINKEQNIIWKKGYNIILYEIIYLFLLKTTFNNKYIKIIKCMFGANAPFTLSLCV